MVVPRWESGARAHGVTDPFGQGPLPWLRGTSADVDDPDDGAPALPWYVDLEPTLSEPGVRLPAPRAISGTRGALRSANDLGLQVKGFAANGSAPPGGSIDFKITVNPPQEISVDIYRIGHYGGAGAHKISGGPPLTGISQPAPLVADRTVSCHHWWMTWRLQIPSHWRAGAYVAVLTSQTDRFRSHIPFTVRDERPSDLLVVLPDVTWQAYNLFPEDGATGASLYHAWDEHGGLLGEDDAALTVSFDRPYAGEGLPLHVGHAFDFVRWAERYGYDLAYANATDLHAGRVDPSAHLGLVFPGHDEYWSAPMRAAAEKARDGGTSLVFLSANTMYWQVELAAAPSGEPDRLVSCRKYRREDGTGRASVPALWRRIGEPEQLLLGVQYQGRVAEPAPLVVRNTRHWLWEGTGLADEDPVENLVAGEADRYFPRVALPPHSARILLAHSPYKDGRGAVRHQETSLYQAPGGALVFAAGTFAWSPALDRPGHTDARIQRATANLLDRICGASGSGRPAEAAG
ncbi:N,N-dimethylformamidase beta subunit family domain-containing protein [Mangrovactinospora gilvigrisea]|uniref:N,N-dimethylformamidase beta subunit family domain-containing protein n=1 Tax=Mangrovactinospora gilvigrisea TaxID=1428644 RepID=UPI000D1AA4C0|nr:N,N-dimethylformamidase beta subunit family domain-containing protein [Mangrovactinospora gilvigrisea]